MKVGFMGLLFLVFLTLKLCGVIAWSWVWVTSPLWIGFAISLVVFLIWVFALILKVRKEEDENKGCTWPAGSGIIDVLL